MFDFALPVFIRHILLNKLVNLGFLILIRI